MSQKYHVTIEDCIDEDDLKQQRLRSLGTAVLDMDRVQNSNVETRGNKRQAWDMMEEQARCEKLQNQSITRANATETACIIQQATR